MRAIHYPCAFGGPDAGCGRAERPYRAFVEVRQEFRTDQPAVQEVETATDGGQCHAGQSSNGDEPSRLRHAYNLW
jgi:hypothetical protein